MEKSLVNFVAIAIFIILSATALLHAAWGFGLLWPGYDQQSLVNTVIGDPNISQIPSLPITLAVAFAILAAGVCALWGAALIKMPLPNWMQKTGVIVLTFIFLIRGLATYIPNGPLAASVEPFQTLNFIYFSPLILAIGAGYAYIWYSTKGT
ncbi:MAG: DUF3995 domain-containing protein [Devosiaceae bacterium]|nr:DUF3995 domain-containing protein [Devosiaceae bacterium]